MRIALVCPYSWTYASGVSRHVGALAEEFLGEGHDVRILTPFDPDDRLARVVHRGTAPLPRALPPHAVDLGRTVGLRANGAVSNIALSTSAYVRLRDELETGGFDVVHVHESNAPVVAWSAAAMASAPLVTTSHCHSTSHVANIGARWAGAGRLLNRARARIAVSEAARWTAERFYGGTYRVIPNGVDFASARTGPKPSSEVLRLLFLGRAEERKGLGVALAAFEALRAGGVAARLTVAGAPREDVEPLLLDAEGVDVAGVVGEEEKWRLLHESDLLCAPSLGGESFGIVLLEALASGTPVVASAIAGYREVARNGVDGLLVPPADAGALAAALRTMAEDPGRRREMGEAGRERAARYAWPRVASEVLEVYEQALAVPEPDSRLARAAVRSGLRPADGHPRRRPGPRPLPGAEGGNPGRPAGRSKRIGAKIAAVAAGLGVVALVATGATPVDAGSVGGALVGAAPLWVLLSLALMGASLVLRAESWHAVLRAALPGVPVGWGDAARATMIGVLMSATLPARLGEPSRALILARRLGRVRERLPVVAGTLVSQTLLNLLALVILGIAVLSTADPFDSAGTTLLAGGVLPAAALAVLLAAPALLRASARRSGRGRLARATVIAGRTAKQVRDGLRVFRDPRLGPRAVAVQMAAWALQWLACWGLLVAFGLADEAGPGGAAAVLFAVNVAGALPIIPANLGVFQAACVAALAAYGVGAPEALAYGVVLQGLELATAMVAGVPALAREGVSWRDVRRRALSAAPGEIALPPRGREGEALA